MVSGKKQILRRVHRKLHEGYGLRADYLAHAATYTGLHASTLLKLDNAEQIKLDVDGVDRNLVYNTLCSFYIRNRADGGKVPTTYELFDALVKMNKLTHMDINSFRKLLLKMGFIWQKIEGRGNKPSSAVVIENPVLRIQRFNYLTLIRKSRVEKYDDVYFIGEVAYNNVMFMDAQEKHVSGIGAWQQRVIYAAGVKTIACMKEVDQFSHAVIEDWMTKELAPSLMQPSVIVVPDTDHFKQKLLETPTLYSTKVLITNWLDFHNIPYSSTMSKYELYSLADEYTDLETPLYKIDGLLKARGHALLRLPKCLQELSPAVMLHQTIKNNWNSEKIRLDLFNADRNTTLARRNFEDLFLNAASYLESFTNSVIGVEQKVMAVERDVDSKLDRLMDNSFVMSSERNDSDVVSCSDSE